MKNSLGFDPVQLLRRLQDAPLDPVVDFLRSLHESRGEATVPLPTAAPPSARADEPEPGEAYDELRQHFYRHEAGLRQHARLTDRILDQLQRESRGRVEPVASPLQAELRVRCAARGASGARFVVANELGREVELGFRCHPLTGVPVGSADTPVADFTPAAPTLAPGEECSVRLGVDLAALPVDSGDEVGLVVDVCGGDEILQKLWVTLLVDLPADEGAHE